jgi:hypothetical protein
VVDQRKREEEEVEEYKIGFLKRTYNGRKK